jgi:hypothetical protein
MQKGYPWAAAGINVSRMVAECFELMGRMGSKGKFAESQRHNWELICGNDDSNAQTSSASAVEGAVTRFAEVFCVAFQLVDQCFISSDSGYMQFNSVLTECREKLQRACNQKHVTDAMRLRKELGLLDPDSITTSSGCVTTVDGIESSRRNSTSNSSNSRSVITEDLLGLNEWTQICESMNADAAKRLGLTTKQVTKTAAKCNRTRASTNNTDSSQRPSMPTGTQSYTPPPARTFIHKSGHICAVGAAGAGSEFWSEYGLAVDTCASGGLFNRNSSATCSAQAKTCALPVQRPRTAA